MDLRDMMLDRRSLMLGLGAAATLPGFAHAQVARGVPTIPGLPTAGPESDPSTARVPLRWLSLRANSI